MISKLGLVVTVALFSSNVIAESSQLQKMKPVHRIDFNKLIEEGNETKQDLTLHPVRDMKKKSVEVTESEEKNAVTKFIDVEVGEGKTPSVVGVDRRYNSVSEPQVVDLEELEVNGGFEVTLIKKEDSGS